MKDFFWFLLGVVLCFFGMVIFVIDPKSLKTPETKTPAPVAAPQCPAPPPCPVAPAPKPPEKYETVIGGDAAKRPERKQDAAPDLRRLLSRLTLRQLHEACAQAEESFLAQNIDEYARPPHDADETKQWMNALFVQIRDFVFKKGSWWHGSVDLPAFKGKVAHVDFVWKLYGAHELEIRDPFTSNMPARIPDASEICYSLRVYVTFDDKTGEESATSVCQNPGRKVGDAFYMTSVLSDKHSPVTGTILVPFPAKHMAPLQLLIDGDKVWTKKTDFTWEQFSVEEWHQIQDRYLKTGGA